MRGQRLACRLILVASGGYHGGLLFCGRQFRLVFFQMQFHLFNLQNELLALAAEQHHAQLVDHELLMLDKLTALTQRAALRNIQRLQCFDVDRIEIKKGACRHGISMAQSHTCEMNNHRMNTSVYALASDCLEGRRCSLHAPPVDAFEQHRQLCPTERHGPLLHLWPNKSAAFQTLGEQTQTVTVVPENLGRAAAPDETTILNFRHLLEKHELNGKILDTVNLYLNSKGIRIATGTIVDATIISTPSSTKNSTKTRDPEMHQTRKGNQYYFGAKAHIGVDSKSSVVHSICTSAASVHGNHMLPDLLHGAEKKIWGDAGYQGQTKTIHEAAPEAQDMTNRRVKTKAGVDEEQNRKNRTKSRVRAKVEWPFRILKRVFKYTKVRYLGLKKNHKWLLTAFALVNLYQHRKRLTPLGRSVSGSRKWLLDTPISPKIWHCCRRFPTFKSQSLRSSTKP